MWCIIKGGQGLWGQASSIRSLHIQDNSALRVREDWYVTSHHEYYERHYQLFVTFVFWRRRRVIVIEYDFDDADYDDNDQDDPDA